MSGVFVRHVLDMSADTIGNTTLAPWTCLSAAPIYVRGPAAMERTLATYFERRAEFERTVAEVRAEHARSLADMKVRHLDELSRTKHRQAEEVRELKHSLDTRLADVRARFVADTSALRDKALRDADAARKRASRMGGRSSLPAWAVPEQVTPTEPPHTDGPDGLDELLAEMMRNEG